MSAASVPRRTAAPASVAASLSRLIAIAPCAVVISDAEAAALLARIFALVSSRSFSCLAASSSIFGSGCGGGTFSSSSTLTCPVPSKMRRLISS